MSERAQPSRPQTTVPARAADGRALLFWFALAAALRLLRLGSFSLWGDEVYSLDQSLRLFTQEMRAGDLAYPIFFLLERGMLALFGLANDPAPDPARMQWVLRIVPAIAGAAAAAAAFASSRQFLTRRERHLLAALVAFSPWLLYFSQQARFYSLMLALAIPATFELLRAQRDATFQRGAIAAAWLFVATLVQPASLLLLCGYLTAAGVAALTRVRPLHRGLIAPAALLAALALAAAIWPSALARQVLFRFTVQDAGIESVSSLLLGIGYNFGPAVAALAFLGLPSLWRRDRALCVHVAVGAGAPTLLLIGLAALHRSVEQRYLLAVVPLALVPAAVFVFELSDRLTSLASGRASAACAAAVVPIAALLPYAPSLVSQYADGNSHDLAAAAAVVRADLRKDDGIIAETHALFGRYLPTDFPPSHLLEAPPPNEAEDLDQCEAMWKECARIWVVVPAKFEDENAANRSFQQWAWTEGRFVSEIVHPRFDYYQNRLRVFLVDPARTRRWFADWRPR